MRWRDGLDAGMPGGACPAGRADLRRAELGEQLRGLAELEVRGLPEHDAQTIAGIGSSPFVVERVRPAAAGRVAAGQGLRRPCRDVRYLN